MKLNHTKRVAILNEVLRIHNMLTSSRRDIDSFATFRREHLDEMLVTVASHLTPPPKPRHRLWQDLRSQDQERLIRKLARKADGYTTPVKLRDMGIVGNVEALPTNQIIAAQPNARPWRSRYAASPTPHLPKYLGRGSPILLPERTPAERVQERRYQLLRDFRIRITPRPKAQVLLPEFVAGLHPDDVCWEEVENSSLDAGSYFRVIAARDICRLNRYFAGQHSLLAGNLYLADPEVNTEVWYCARLHFPRKGLPTLDRCYLGRTVLPRTNQVVVTQPYKTGTAPFIAARDTFAGAMSSILYQEEKI
jgi:hypothetical protein